MARMTDDGRAQIAEIASRHGVTLATAERLAAALARTGGGQVQFDEPELGGLGQWSRGGMVMIGDMFNNALKARVDALCGELAGLVGRGIFPAAPSGSSSRQGGWWPEGLGTPASVGAQNQMRYAFFPESRRLAIDDGGRIIVYDTGDHRLSGFSQQQSGDRSLSFTSQHGPVRITDLAVVPESGAVAPAAEDVYGKIERLAELHARGILTAQEFEAKKADLLGRL